MAELTGLRLWSNPGYTRVVLDLSAEAEFTANFLPGDPGAGRVPRLYVDIRRAVPGQGVAELTQVRDGLLTQVRTGRFDGETIRVVLDLVSLKDYKIFPLSDPARIVLDVTGDQPTLSADHPQLTAPAKQEKDPVVARERHPVPPPVQAQAPNAGPVLRRVVVDAGHGGKDPGAVGPGGTMEKDITLALAKLLASKLRQEIGCEVILTRNSDVFLPLEERTAIANRVGADLFISVHANAAPNRNAYGIETYYLNFSRSDKAAAVAARENGTSLKQVGDLELILFDLMANSKINESSRLAAEIQKSLVTNLRRDFTEVKDLGVRQGPFYVLLGATMPSVLVEAGFISHSREEVRLKDVKFQEKTATAIVRGVQQFANSLRMVAAQ
ncbi:MAG: N-acetylmuramoyl-L-alanine amidase [Desulfuromonadales bacterium]|nr:N-acetylmuramoyl-L-alanine amidase [Desulfuromonadales bacterium]